MALSIDFKKIRSLPFVKGIYRRYPEAQVYLVGGAVRDFLMKKKQIKDLDFVIRNVAIEDLITLLQEYGVVNYVGKKFGVLKFKPLKGRRARFDIDIALPRKEKSRSKKGRRRDFDIQSDPLITIQEDLRRRDFSINAMAYEIGKEKLIDPYGGQKDIKKKVIRCVGEPRERFCEDYSRLLRAVRFACQLNFTLHHATLKQIKKISPFLKRKKSISREVLATELTRALYERPFRALSLFIETGVWRSLFPELNKIYQIPIKGKKTLLDYTLAMMKDLEKNIKPGVRMNARPSIYTLLGALTLHYGLNEGKWTNHYFKKSAKKTRKWCFENKIPSALYFSIDPSGLTWMHESLDFLYRKENALTYVDLERIFFNKNKPACSLLKLIETHEKVARNFGLNQQIFPFIRKRMKRMKHKGKLIQPLVNGHILEKWGISRGLEISKYLKEIREKQFRSEIRDLKEAEDFVKKRR